MPRQKTNITYFDNAAEWWRCDCGALIPDAPRGAGTLVFCEACGQAYRYYHRALNRFKYDRAASALQPHRALLY